MRTREAGTRTTAAAAALRFSLALQGSLALGASLALGLALEACAHDDRPSSSAPTLEPAVTAVTNRAFELASQRSLPYLDRLAHELALAEPIALAEPLPPARASAAEIDEQLAAAEGLLRELGVRAKPRRANPRAPLDRKGKLERAYAEQRALVVEGRLDQVREWMALAKFGHAEPGPLSGSLAGSLAGPLAGSGQPPPLARYDLVVTRDPRKPSAYLHVIVPERGLAPSGSLGVHEAWIAEQRWVNLSDRLTPARDYLPYKTNGRESLHRQWARADIVEDLVRIAGAYRQQTGVLLGIGDLSHVTGGKIEDHWTHQDGVDVDVYLLDPVSEAEGSDAEGSDAEGSEAEGSDASGDARPRVWWNHVKRGRSVWTSKEQGKGEHEPTLDPDDPLSHTPSSRRLEILAQIVFGLDAIAYFVHNDTRTLARFDAEVGERRPGRRFLHAKNRGYWPTHADHVHLRWVDGELPVDVTPRP
jgi:hypothetical protein